VLILNYPLDTPYLNQSTEFRVPLHTDMNKTAMASIAEHQQYVHLFFFNSKD
jgi:hypothetical protein